MTVISNTNKGGPWAGDGVTTRFDFAFYAPSPGDVRVYVDNAQLSEGYTVVLSGSDGGYVLFDTPPASGTTIAALRLVEPTQETDIQNNTAFYPEVIENALDKLTMLCQQQQEAIGRCLIVPVTGETATPSELLTAVSSAVNEAVRAANSSAQAAGAAQGAAMDGSAAADRAAAAADRAEAVFDKTGGVPIGAVFPSPGAIPPEGAYLLNGQTIPNCADEYKTFWEWVNTSGVRILDNATFEAELAQYDVCDGFVLDSATGNVRLPKWHWQSPLGETLPVRGNGTTLGYTGTDDSGNTVKGGVYQSSNQGYFNFSTAAYGLSVGTRDDGVNEALKTNGVIGLTPDPDKSGIVAENNAPMDHFIWCIQVFNAATALSEQESAQLASQMQMKAQTDFGNVAENLDFVVESWEDGQGNGYSLYRSGKLEQWGVYKPTADSKTRVIALWKEFDSDKYVVLLTKYNNATTYWTPSAGIGIYKCTPTGFTAGSDQDGGVSIYTMWFAIGRAATE